MIRQFLFALAMLAFGITLAFAQTATAPTLTQQLIAYLKSPDFQVLLYVLASGTVGVFAHWWVQWLRGNISENLFEYLFTTNLKNTLLTFSIFVGAAVTAVATGNLAADNLQSVITLGFTTGFSIDSLANRTGINGAAQISTSSGIPPNPQPDTTTASNT